MKLIISLVCLLTISANAQSLLKSSRGNKFNPSIGLNALTLFENNNRDSDHDGFSIQEIELQFSSDVDAYFRAEATIALHQEEAEGDEHSHEFKVEPEEVFVETISIPKFTFKIGKFYANFGKYNALHTHAQPFIYRSKSQENIFGEEAFASTGLGVSFLKPLPWFSEFSFQALQPSSEELFGETHHELAYVLKSKNLWELNEKLTLELGLSGLLFSAHNHEDDTEMKTTLYGADLTFKWVDSIGSKKSSLVWSSEYINKKKEGSENAELGTFNSFVNYKINSKWLAGVQYEYIGLGSTATVDSTNVYTVMAGYIPTEFSSIRAQFDTINDNQLESEKRLLLQLNISIGAHPAHLY